MRSSWSSHRLTRQEVPKTVPASLNSEGKGLRKQQAHLVPTPGEEAPRLVDYDAAHNIGIAFSDNSDSTSTFGGRGDDRGSASASAFTPELARGSCYGQSIEVECPTAHQCAAAGPAATNEIFTCSSTHKCAQ